MLIETLVRPEWPLLFYENFAELALAPLFLSLLRIERSKVSAEKEREGKRGRRGIDVENRENTGQEREAAWQRKEKGKMNGMVEKTACHTWRKEGDSFSIVQKKNGCQEKKGWVLNMSRSKALNQVGKKVSSGFGILQLVPDFIN